MKKSCCVCENSVEVKYTKDYKEEYTGKRVVQNKFAYFCIAAPPSANTAKARFPWAKIKLGYVKLRKLAIYPLVFSKFPDDEAYPCALYCKTENKKKISRYEEILESRKQSKEKAKKEAEEQKKIAQEMQRQRKIEHEIKKAKKEKTRLEKKKAKKKREYQKEYRNRKKKNKDY